jgi:hypothetical protein
MLVQAWSRPGEQSTHRQSQKSDILVSGIDQMDNRNGSFAGTIYNAKVSASGVVNIVNRSTLVECPTHALPFF